MGSAEAGRNYVFRGRGPISERAAGHVAGFRGMLVIPVPPETLVFGTVADPAWLPAILDSLECLGLQVGSVHRVRELPPRSGCFTRAR
ncbi:MAG TPA: hypothetical protein VJX66_19565 [Amycolatopsis sp.]|nr:hypothetical protein [Amycolatopsis sp.]